MAQEHPSREPEKLHGDPAEDSAAAVSPDTQRADPTAAADGAPEPADTQSDEYAAGTADQDDADESEPGAHGTDADTVSDGPDKDSGFYG